jgi:hypothetical protein
LKSNFTAGHHEKTFFQRTESALSLSLASGFDSAQQNDFRAPMVSKGGSSGEPSGDA